jgi:hypothetical protein
LYADQIVEAATVPQKHGLYCLGPFPRRVSFSAQQYRALNLVWALREQDCFEPGAEVAIIGAGLAGLTAAAGFVGYGCKVDVYEEAAIAMARQRDTYHRMVHPSVNRWPSDQLTYTTELPVMEWYASPCSRIAENISVQFDNLAKQVKFIPQTEVTDIVTVATDRLLLKSKPPVPQRRSYDLVLVAIGFGEETSSGPFPPVDYWNPDTLESSRHQNAATNYIVSGSGDGGLIDVLRLVHREFRRGKLIFETAAALSNTSIAQKIETGEKRVKSSLDVGELRELYESCAKNLDEDNAYGEISLSLGQSYWQTGNLVYLIDRSLEAPYSMRSAPIHKLMIAHAIRNGAVEFHRGTVEKSSDQILAADKMFSENACKVIVRHGATANFHRLLGKTQVDALRKKQEALSDFHATKLWTGAFPVPAGYPVHDPKRPEFIKHRESLAKRAIQEISADAELWVTKGGYKVVFPNHIPTEAPTKLFGISVRSETISTGRGILG